MIGPGTTIKGKLSGEEDLRIEGNVEGTIQLSQSLTVAESAVVNAQIEAQSVEIAGKVVGNIQVDEIISVNAGAVVVGELSTPRLSIADGARFKGHVEMDFELPGAEMPKGRRR